jgi:hypothetical protein
MGYFGRLIFQYAFVERALECNTLLRFYFCELLESSFKKEQSARKQKGFSFLNLQRLSTKF